MSARTRLALFSIAAAGLFAVLLAGFRGLPPVGRIHGPYGDAIARVAVPERHASNAVAAINYDYRSLDTLGEEFILFVSAVGVSVLLRQSTEKREHGGEEDDDDESVTRDVPGPSDAIRTAAQGLTGVTVLFGLYLVAHGPVTPGGGFQGGMVLATVPLLVYLAGDPRILRKIAPEWLVELSEGGGAAALVVIGSLGLIVTRAYLENVLPLGPPSSAIDSGGTLLAMNWATAFEVAGGFVLVMLIFLAEALAAETDRMEGS